MKKEVVLKVKELGMMVKSSSLKKMKKKKDLGLVVLFL